MKEEGTVIKVENGASTVEIKPQKECARCCSCQASKIRYITVSGEKARSLKKGDRVEVSIDTSSMMRIYFLFYGIPLVVFVGGAIILHAISGSPILSFTGAILLTVLAYILVGFYIRKNSSFSPEVCPKRNTK